MKTGRIPLIRKWMKALVVLLALLVWFGAPFRTTVVDAQLMKAAERGDFASVNTHPAKGVGAGAANTPSDTAHMSRAAERQADVVGLLRLTGGKPTLSVAKKADEKGDARESAEKRDSVNAKDEFGRTPLMNAATAGGLEQAGWLLNMGADVNAKGHNGRTALLEAAWAGHRNTVKH